MGGRRMKALIVVIIEDTPAAAVHWPALGPEIEDLAARHLGLDGDQVGLRILAVTDDDDPDVVGSFGEELEDLWWDDDPLVVDVPVGAYL
jgi:hypothetical protein